LADAVWVAFGSHKKTIDSNKWSQKKDELRPDFVSNQCQVLRSPARPLAWASMGSGSPEWFDHTAAR
jgi:hypothetical protein